MIKKYYLMSCLFILLFIMSGCQSRSSNVSVTENASVTEISESIILSPENRLLLNPSVTIFMYENAPVFMNSPEVNAQWGGLHIFKLHEIRGRRVNTISSLPQLYFGEDVSVKFQTLAFGSDRYFYMPLVFTADDKERHKIARFNFSVSSVHRDMPRELIIKELNQPTYVNLFVENDQMIIFKSTLETDTFVYTVKNLDLSTGLYSVIVQKNFSTLANTGEMISNIFMEDSSIFLYRIKVDIYGSTMFFVEEYDFFGNLLNTHNFQNKDFLYMDEINSYDTVASLFKKDDLFIFHTLHDRIAIFRLSNGLLVEVNVPDNFRRVGGVSIVQQFFADNGLIYFWDYIDSNLYIFDLNKEDFFVINVEFGEYRVGDFFEDMLGTFEQKMENVHRDSYGNLIFQIRINHSIYMEHMERLIQAGEISGGFPSPWDAASFTYGDRLLYRVSIDEIRSKHENLAVSS